MKRRRPNYRYQADSVTYVAPDELDVVEIGHRPAAALAVSDTWGVLFASWSGPTFTISAKSGHEWEGR